MSLPVFLACMVAATIWGFFIGLTVSSASPSGQHDPTKNELLAAIRILLHWISPEPGKPEDPRPLSEVVKQAREVIAKAERP